MVERNLRIRPRWSKSKHLISVQSLEKKNLFLCFLLIFTTSTYHVHNSTSSTLGKLSSNLYKSLFHFAQDDKSHQELFQRNTNITGATSDLRDPDTTEIIPKDFGFGHSLLDQKFFPRLRTPQFFEMAISLMNRTNPILEVNHQINKLLKIYSKEYDLSTMLRLSNSVDFDPKKIIIVSYKDFEPSRMMDTLIERTRLFRNIWQSLKFDFPMNSIYLRNLGMEIIQAPDEVPLQVFKQILSHQSYLINEIYEDVLLKDGDTDIYERIETTLENPEIDLNEDSLITVPLNLSDTRNEDESLDTIRNLGTSSVPNDFFFSEQWPFIDTGDSRWGVEIQSAWELTSATSKPTENFTIALIDSGVDFTHPDLSRSLWRNPGEICDNGIDDDQNGYIDDCYGWDFVNNDKNPKDDNGHGTASAGILAAQTNNGIGVAGICWNCKIMILKALNHQIKGSVSGFIRAIDYSLEKGILLSSNSYGGRGSNFDGLEEAIKRAQKQGMIFVAAAGNYKGNNDNDRNPVYPASYHMDNVISVAAITRNGKLANFSSYGRKSVDIAAPGEKIYSTFLGPGYKFVDGTSFAVPFVTGAIAMIWSFNPGLTYKEVISSVLENQKPCPYLEGLTKTAGVLDIDRAITQSSLKTQVTIMSEKPNNWCYKDSDCQGDGSICHKEKSGNFCTCKHGFEGDGYTCKDIDECKYNPCGDVSTCFNRIGTFVCLCNNGFKRIDDKCEDVDECEDTSRCPSEAECHNFAGTYECVCPEGFHWIIVNDTSSKCIPHHIYSSAHCLENGGCPPNSHCKTHKSFWFSTMKCECLPGYFKDKETELCIREGLMNFQKQQYLELLSSRATVKESHINRNWNNEICFFGICF